VSHVIVPVMAVPVAIVARLLHRALLLARDCGRIAAVAGGTAGKDSKPPTEQKTEP
jgi:hypothetical protein